MVLSPAFYPGTVTYAATVGGTALTLTPTAWVGDQVLSASVNGAPVPVTSGSATAPHTLNPGSNTVQVVVAPGDGIAAPRTYTVTVVVVQAQPTLTLARTAGGNPSAHGAGVGFTATLAGGSSPTGTVTFRDGATVLCTVAASPYTCTTAALALGAHTITASYAGDASNAAVTSNALAHSVAKAQPTLALAVGGSNPSAPGASVSFTATLAGGSSPTGTVTFRDGATVLCTVAASPYTCTTAALALGAHTITASYAGDAHNAAATSGALAHTVGHAVQAPVAVPTLGAWGVWLLSWLAAVLGMRRLRPARAGAGAPRRT